MKNYEVQFKQINANLKVLNRSSTNKKTDYHKENTTEGIREKVNEIKPEMVKLWAKIDTIEDRLCFS